MTIKKWSFIKDGAIVETITNGISGGKRNLVGGRGSANHTDERLLAHGYLPHLPTGLGEYQKYNSPIVYIIGQDSIDYEITPWTQEEIDADLLAKANQALFVVTEANAELAYWVNKTPQEITDIIAAAPNTFASFKQMIEKNAQSVRVIALFLKLLRDTGRIG